MSMSEDLEWLYGLKNYPNELDHVPERYSEGGLARAIAAGRGTWYRWHVLSRRGGVPLVPGEDSRAQAIAEGYGLFYAEFIDKAPRDDTRAAAIVDGFGCNYAILIDKTPRDDTRAAAIAEGKALAYAAHVEGPHDDTRAAAIAEGKGYEYAELVEGPHDDTRAAAIAEGKGYEYARWVDRAPRDDTRAAACAAPCAEPDEERETSPAYEFARYVDRAPRDDTRESAYRQGCLVSYARDVDGGPCHEGRELACRFGPWAVVYASRVDRRRRDDTERAAEAWGRGCEEEYERRLPRVLRDASSVASAWISKGYGYAPLLTRYHDLVHSKAVSRTDLLKAGSGMKALRELPICDRPLSQTQWAKALRYSGNTKSLSLGPLDHIAPSKGKPAMVYGREIGNFPEPSPAAIKTLCRALDLVAVDCGQVSDPPEIKPHAALGIPDASTRRKLWQTDRARYWEMINEEE